MELQIIRNISGYDNLKVELNFSFAMFSLKPRDLPETMAEILLFGYNVKRLQSIQCL